MPVRLEIQPRQQVGVRPGVRVRQVATPGWEEVVAHHLLLVIVQLGEERVEALVGVLGHGYTRVPERRGAADTWVIHSHRDEREVRTGVTGALVFLLYLFGIPYIFLMVMVVVGMFRHGRKGRSDKLPGVSVVLPAHNEEAKLGATLASLAEQRYGGELEFVIVDDRSTDGTRQVIEAYVARDPRFKLVSVTEPSRKLAPKVNAVNHGIRRSLGEIVLATDADCRYHPEWVAGMVEHFEDDVAMVVGYVSTSRPGEARTLLQRFESVDWFTLMLVSRSMTQLRPQVRQQRQQPRLPAQRVRVRGRLRRGWPRSQR